MNTKVNNKRLQPSSIQLPHGHHHLLQPLHPGTTSRDTRPCTSFHCSCLPSTSTSTPDHHKFGRVTAVSAAHANQPCLAQSPACSSHAPTRKGFTRRFPGRASLVIVQAKRGRVVEDDGSGPDDGDDDVFGAAADDDIALDGADDADADLYDEEDEEGGFDEQLGDLEDEEDEAEEEGPTEDEDEEGLDEDEGEGEEEAGIEELPYQIEEIDFKEFAKRGEVAPFSAQPAQVSLPTEAEIRAVEPLDDGKGMVIPEGAQLALNRQGYQAFQMGDIEFLVSETPDGKLDLRDCFIFDGGPEIYARPEVSGDLPDLPIVLQAIPWVERKSGDFLKQKASYAQMKKVYFVGVQTLRPYRMALDQVYKFESATRVLSKETVRTVGNPKDPILRIRADGLTVEDSGQIPTPSQMLQQGDIQLPDETEEARQARIQEMEERAEELDRLDEQPDVPSSDMF